MDVAGLIDKLKGSDTQAVFGARVGIDQSTVSKLLLGKIAGGRAVLAGLIAAYPERQDEIVAVFCAPKKAIPPYVGRDGNTDAAQ